MSPLEEAVRSPPLVPSPVAMSLFCVVFATLLLCFLRCCCTEGAGGQGHLIAATPWHDASHIGTQVFIAGVSDLFLCTKTDEGRCRSNVTKWAPEG